MKNLLSKHGASSKLGITPAALMKLVKSEQVPYVRLPGKGDIRFDESDLAKWIQAKKGGYMITAEKTERERMQEHVRKIPDYRAEIDRLEGDRAAIQAHVDSGKSTERALVPVDTELNRLRDLLGKAQNQFKSKLVDSCENQELRDEWFELNEQRRAVSRELLAEKRLLEETERNLKNLNESLYSLEGDAPNDTTGCKPSERSEYGQRLQKLHRDITSQQRFEKRYKDRISELTDRRDQLEAEKLRVREEMILS